MPLKLMCGFYDEKEIGGAKECLFALLDVYLSTRRNVWRKGANDNYQCRPTLHILLNAD